jgi:hypothetical protein
MLRVESTCSMANVQEYVEKEPIATKNIIPANWKKVQRRLSPKSSERNRLFCKYLNTLNV